jgi:hypothetical protein
MMKRILVSLFLSALVAVISGCGDSKTDSKQPKLVDPVDPNAPGPVAPGGGAPAGGAPAGGNSGSAKPGID